MKKVSILLIFTILVVGLPLAGVFLTGRSPWQFVSFPPLTRPEGHTPFSWPVFILYLLLETAIVCFIGTAARRRPSGRQPDLPIVKRPFPIWGWGALVALAVFWFLAWTRLPGFDTIQRHTFFPLWLAYIVAANACCYSQSGNCPLLKRPVFFLLLFPVSSVFWWYFEYLNQFVHNWYYTGVDYGPLAYSIHAGISFSTVLPAVYTTRTWISGLKWFKQRFYPLPSLPTLNARFFAWAMLCLACAGLTGISLRPDLLFSLIWVAPLIILTSLQYLAGQNNIFSKIAEGDWRPVVSAALAALVCGFFWEMWNYYSLAKWTYSIPYVYRFKIFEMPVLGYMGYLPFGLECIAVIEFMAGPSVQEGEQR